MIAALVSIGSLLVSFKALRLAEQQDVRKRPVLVVSLLNAYVQFEERDKARNYAFLISISNRSDSDNAVAQLDLYITYKTLAQAVITARAPSEKITSGTFLELAASSLLTPPIRIDAHQTITGWATFRIAEPILRDATIEEYIVSAIDSHNITTSVGAIMVQEYTREAISPLRKDSTQ